jgi:hypothetical protein
MARHDENLEHAVPAMMRYVTGNLYAATLTILLGLAVPSAGGCQEPSGSTGAAFAGAALGAYSGGMLGTVGSVVPCTQTYWGAKCVRWSAAIGGAIGLASGVVTGASDSAALERAAKTAGIGFGVGVLVGLAVKPIAQRVGWQDVAAVGLIGGAVGAAPKGAVIGLGVGTVVGLTLSHTVDSFNLPDVVGAAVAGTALGALADWVVSAINASGDTGMQGGAQLVIPLRVSF